MDTRAATWVTVDAGRHGIGPEARWLSIRQVGSDLGVSSSTAYKWSARGRRGSPAPFVCTTATFASDGTGTKRGWGNLSSDLRRQWRTTTWHP
jgi:hypothetical protein